MNPTILIRPLHYRRFGTIRVWLLDTRRLPLAQLARHLSTADRREWRKIRARKMARLFLVSRVLAPLLARQLNRRNQTLARLPSGQPVLADGFISISRCDPFVVVALARRPVGLDLERIRHDRALIDAVTVCFNPQEQSEIMASGAAASRFCRTWTRKEALTKLSGLGICTDLAAVDTLHPAARLQSVRIRGGYWLSVASQASAHTTVPQ